MEVAIEPSQKTLPDFTRLARIYALNRVRQIRATNPRVAQRRILSRLITPAAETRFGKEHEFSRISGVEAFQNTVALRDYDAFRNGWWGARFPEIVNTTWPGRIPDFALTSGTTTGRSKHIPYTPAMRRAAVRGFLDLLCFHLTRNPASKVLGGRFLALTGPATLEVSQGARSGAVSAITALAVPSYLRPRILPNADLAKSPDWRRKIRDLAPLALASDVRFLGGSPNWLLIFLEEVARVAGGPGKGVADWSPNLELVAHGGVNFAPYRSKFSKLLKGSGAETRELYSASEGVFAYADRGDGEGLRLHLDGQVFFEFVPVETIDSARPVRHWIGTAEPGIDYALATSTAAGL